MLALAACDRPLPATGPGTRQAGPLIMTRFVQPSPDQVWFALSREVEVAGVVRIAAVPPTIPDRLAQYEYEPLQQQDGALTINFDERQTPQVWSAIIVMLPRRCREPGMGDRARFRIKPGCEGIEYVEFMRQPAAWLLEQFGFERPEGYTVLGRRTIEARGAKIRPLEPYVFHGFSRVNLGTTEPAAIPVEAARFPELVTAVRVVRWLWRHDMRVGPHAFPYDDFLALPLDRKLTMLAGGRFAVLCAGMRDLFLHAVLSIPGIRARVVGAYDYAPSFAHLISHSHATSEIYVEALAKWVMVDAWAGIMIARRDGTLLSAEEIRGASAADLKIVPIRGPVKRFYTTKDNRNIPFVHNPVDVKLTEYTISSDGAAPGYLTYYKHLLYAEATLLPGGRPGPGD